MISKPSLDFSCCARYTLAVLALLAAATNLPARAQTYPTKPITIASSTTEPSTWRRDAPIIRRSPNSLVRWATV